MKSVIMAGGFGTRLRPLTNNLPKPMVAMANRPMIVHIIELFEEPFDYRYYRPSFFQPEMITAHLGEREEPWR